MRGPPPTSQVRVTNWSKSEAQVKTGLCWQDAKEEDEVTAKTGFWNWEMAS